jgi:UPF0271 protein
MPVEIDLNSDLGEGAPYDEELLALVTSANVACGFHTGDALTSLRTLQLAHARGVVIGAHPGHHDRAQFGRRELPLTPEQVYAECVYQIGALIGLARSAGARVRYVKPHGGLYHQACREERFAEPVVAAAQLFGLGIISLPGSRLETLAHGRCPFTAEGFADRRYHDDGSLVPRDEPNAFIENPEEAVDQVDRLVHGRGVRTICVHGDNPDALIFVRALRDALRRQGVLIRPFA